MLAAVARDAAGPGLAVWLVGGAVRDLLLGRPFRDLDLAIVGTSGEVAELAGRLAARPGWRLEASHGRFGTATLTAPGGYRVDLAATRTETYARPAALPIVAAGARLEADLGRRDFTIHALARRLEADGSLGPLVDPYGGRRDLADRVLRLLHPGSLADDPTRAFRAVRYAARLGFGLDRGFRAALRRAREEGAFDATSGDRLRRALEEALGEDDFGKATALLLRYELLDDICAGWGETLPRESPSRGKGRSEGAAAAGVASRWSRLLSGLSAPKRRDVADRLKFSRALRRSAGVPLR